MNSRRHSETPTTPVRSTKSGNINSRRYSEQPATAMHSTLKSGKPNTRRSSEQPVTRMSSSKPGSRRNSEKPKTTDADVQRLEKDIRETFNLFDKNRDKCLSADELGRSLRSLGFRLTTKEVQLAVKQIDKNGNGMVEYTEFRDFVLSQVRQSGCDKEQQLRQMFSVFDKDNNGYIDKNELRRAMKTLGEKLTEVELEEMLQQADDNSDGKIDYEEFVHLLTHKLAE